MLTSSIFVLSATIFVIVIIIIYGCNTMKISSKTIFPGSGSPESMAKIVLSSIQLTAQILFGILVIGILCVMILEEKIESNAGLPIVAGVVGYLLGKSFKDVYEGAPKNKGTDS